MKAWIAFWIGALALLAALLFWRNSITYGRRSVMWRLLKSAADMILIVLSAIQLPALLVAWCVLWVTSPIENRAVKVTMSVIAGMAFGLLGVSALEVLILCSVFSIDQVTGRNGFLKHWYNTGEEEAQILAA